MPNLWANVDLNFPTFAPNEETAASLEKLRSYMFTLTEALKYALENLDEKNWNAAALTDNRKTTTENVEAETASLAEQLKALKEETAALKETVEALTEEVEILNATAADALRRANDAVLLLDYMNTDGDKVELHGERVDINGSVYINGTLQT